ncbi:hypothetical protein [Microvirga calopogonii]|uniref:hypothetical protein n=1 Tax=Microvirga calopogonii TaxID=2078013 RepID=UPI0013B3EDAE|nr:hypothetical protein [Microvirga calopogonii]
MNSTIVLGRQLTDWTIVELIDFGPNRLDGIRSSRRFVGEAYYFVIGLSTIAVATNTAMWLNTDQIETTTCKVWDRHHGAGDQVDELRGFRKSLNALEPNDSVPRLTNGVSFKRSANGNIGGPNIGKVKVDTSTAITALIDLNAESAPAPNGVSLSDGCSQFLFTPADQPLRDKEVRSK